MSKALIKSLLTMFFCFRRAADYLVRTGPVVTLEVAKQGAIYHGLATLLQQPSPVTQRGESKKKQGYLFGRIIRSL